LEKIERANNKKTREVTWKANKQGIKRGEGRREGKKENHYSSLGKTLEVEEEAH
jgi:hypothetical protein